jgi:hypothetical protein
VGIFQVEDDAASSLLPTWIEAHLVVNVFWETEIIPQSKDRSVGPQLDAEAFNTFQIFEIVLMVYPVRTQFRSCRTLLIMPSGRIFCVACCTSCSGTAGSLS